MVMIKKLSAVDKLPRFGNAVGTCIHIIKCIKFDEISIKKIDADD